MEKNKRLKKAGYIYHLIVETENDLRKKLGIIWQMFLIKELLFFKKYSFKEKFEIIKKHTDKNNEFIEYIYSFKYKALSEYYSRELIKEKLFFSTKNNYSKEELRCLFALMHEIYFEDYYKIKSLLKSGDNILDIGANIGMYSLAVKLLFPKTNIIAIEPSRKSFILFKKNLAGYKNIKAYNLAVGDKKTAGYLNISTNNLLNKIDDNLDSKMKSVVVKRERVKILPIDEIVTGKTDVIKMDIEGYERYALIGGRLLINKHKPLLLCAVEHSPKQKKVIIETIRKICTEYKNVDLNDKTTCFYIPKKHMERVVKLRESLNIS